MIALHRDRHTRTMVIGLAVLLIAGAVAAQYARSAWPFTAGETTTPSAEVAPAPVAAAPSSHAEHGAPAVNGATPPDAAAAPHGYAPVTIDPAQAKALLLTTALVEERDFTKILRTVGVVALDETRTAHVHTKIRGWIDRIHVDYVGRRVRAGESLASIYSQEVYAAQVEYLSLLASRPAEDPLLQAARRRLSLWDVPASELERLGTTREPGRTFPLLAPRAGVVIAKEALEGMIVDPSIELYTVSDLAHLWVLADIYEADVPYVRVGDQARLGVEGREVPTLAAVTFLSPTIDEATRTRKARFVLDNKDQRFLPGAFVAVAMDVRLGRGLAVPETAIIRTGTRSIAFVVHGEQGEHFEPREVTLGPLVGDHYRVDKGLAAGERVATGAQFLLDSESRLRASSAPGGSHAH